MVSNRKRALPFIALLVWPLACIKGGNDAPPAGGSDSGGAHHAHVAPRGGTLVELGDHEASLEFVYDSETGLVHMYILDAHAENPVRLTAISFLVQFDTKIDGERTSEEGQFVAEANELTGETMGDTSQFRLDTTPLFGQDVIGVAIPQVIVHGVAYRDITAQIQPFENTMKKAPDAH